MNTLKLTFGDVRAKHISTPNDFVSHMIEHIAWRLGCSIELVRDNEDWQELGTDLGAHVRAFLPQRTSAAAIGMLDDGSAEALIELDQPAGLDMAGSTAIDLDWFLSLRCEQLESGQGLKDLLTGLSRGLEARIAIVVCSLEDPHHTWEGVFRAVGSALSKLFTPELPALDYASTSETNIDYGDIVVKTRSAYLVEIHRHTAESGLTATVDFQQKQPSAFTYQGGPIAHYRNSDALTAFKTLMDIMANEAGFSYHVVFSSKMLSSSHVLLEDSGMALGKALREVMVKRMMDLGVNGGGGSLHTPTDFHHQPIRVGISVEGRKFWRFVPLTMDYDHIRRNLIIGQTIMNGLYSEDLDDFLDGLSWGLGCSLVIHIKELLPAETAWPMIFKHLGTALGELFRINPYRRGVPPGVKANLA
jgi:imidazoleglycerol phosphate dehydratase HisB